ncbi:Hypothetical protein POVR2_LOCUS157 [uncultured virus]|nr:Hypothetical protein POVR2_LOCUS157 [uncultured virus]
MLGELVQVAIDIPTELLAKIINRRDVSKHIADLLKQTGYIHYPTMLELNRLSTITSNLPMPTVTGSVSRNGVSDWVMDHPCWRQWAVTASGTIDKFKFSDIQAIPSNSVPVEHCLFTYDQYYSSHKQTNLLLQELRSSTDIAEICSWFLILTYESTDRRYQRLADRELSFCDLHREFIELLDLTIKRR